MGSARELAKKRMMASVPKTNVVITNPTTLAVALEYDRELINTPQRRAGRGSRGPDAQR